MFQSIQETDFLDVLVKQKKDNKDLLEKQHGINQVHQLTSMNSLLIMWTPKKSKMQKRTLKN